MVWAVRNPRASDKATWNKTDARVNCLDHRILLGRLEVERLVKNSEEVGLSVSRLDDDFFWRLPLEVSQAVDIRARQLSS